MGIERSLQRDKRKKTEASIQGSDTEVVSKLQRHSRCSLGGESFSAMAAAEENESDARRSPDEEIDASAGEALEKEAIDQAPGARASKKKKKKCKSSKKI